MLGMGDVYPVSIRPSKFQDFHDSEVGDVSYLAASWAWLEAVYDTFFTITLKGDHVCHGCESAPATRK